MVTLTVQGFIVKNIYFRLESIKSIFLYFFEVFKQIKLKSTIKIIITLVIILGYYEYQPVDI